MNLNHALIVGELAGNTNFPRPPLRTCSNCIRVCTRIRMCGAWIEQEAGGGRKPRFLAHSTLCNIKMEKLEGWRRRKGVVFSYPLERACPHFHQGRPSLLAVARRTRVYIYIYMYPTRVKRDHLLSFSLSLERTKYRFPVSALLREWPQPWGLHTVHLDHLLTSAYTSRERQVKGEGGRVHRVYGWWNAPCRHGATLVSLGLNVK